MDLLHIENTAPPGSLFPNGVPAGSISPGTDDSASDILRQVGTARLKKRSAYARFFAFRISYLYSFQRRIRFQFDIH